MAVSVAALVMWHILPLLPLFVWSFARNWNFPALLPTRWSLSPWYFAFSPSSGVLASMAESISIAAMTTLISLLVGIPAGRALGLHQFKGKRFLELLFLAPVIVPGIATVLGTHWLFLNLGLTGTTWGVILVHVVPALPYVILVMSGAFANYDIRLEQQARNLGATATQTFRHETLPAMGPSIAVAALFAFLVSWSQYILTLVVGSGHIITLPLLLFNFVAAGRNDLMGAIAVIYIVPCAALLLLISRYVSGRSASVMEFTRP